MRHLICFLIFISVIESYGQYGPVPPFFEIQRELPFVEMTTTATISVADYGAVVDDGNDDTVAIQNAINAAVNLATEENPVKLVFESGTYNLITDDSETHTLQMTNAKWILWDGHDAEFLVHNATVGFLNLTNCENTIIKDFTVDYLNLPFTQGKVTEVNVGGGYFEFQLDPGFPPPTGPSFMNSPQRWGMIKNANGSLKKGAPNLIPHQSFFQSLGNNTFRYSQSPSSTLTSIDVGDYFVHIARYNGRTIIRNNGGKNLTYMNVTGYASPAGGFNALNSEEWNILNCGIRLKDNRVHSINADCMHVNGGSIGPWVEDSVFEGFSDDCLNIKYTKRVIVEALSPTLIKIRGNVFEGETMEFYNPRNGILLGSATVTNVQAQGSNQFNVTLSNAINITDVADEDHQSTDKAYVESRSNNSFVFKNNIIRNSRRFGLLIQSKFALIENNLFENTSSSGIAIQNGVDWGEGFRAQDIVINNNTFINCGFDTSYIDDHRAAAIMVDFRRLSSPCNLSMEWCGTQTASFQGHSNITISNNEIIYNKRGIYVKNTNGVNIHNNFICHSGQDITLGSNESPIPQTVLNSSNVSIIDYDYELPTPNAHFVLNETSTEDEIINTGTNSIIGLEVNLSGGTITQGHFDDEVGHSILVNTQNNGSLRMMNTQTQLPFIAPISNQARSFAFWIKPEEGIFQNLLTSGGPNDGETFSIQMTANGVVRVTDNNQNTVRMSDMPLDIGSWNHVVVSVPEGSLMRNISLYKNGVPSNKTYTGVNVSLNTSENPTNLFSRFNGTVSDFRFFDYGLCSGDVERIYNDRYFSLSTDDFTANENKIIVYPTSTPDKVFFSQPINSVEVYNLAGRKLYSEKSDSINHIDLSDLSTGFYLLKINNKQTEKIIKK